MADHSKTIQGLTAENDVLKKRIHELNAMEVDRKREEEKLLLIQKAVEDSGDAIGLADGQGNHFYQNKAFTRLLGYTVDELKVKGLAQTVYADQEVAQDVFKTIMQGGSWSGEVEDIAKDGRRLTVMLRADAIKDESGKIIGLLAINTDITEHKKTEAALQASEARFKSIVATSQEWIWAIDTQGVHTYSNSTIEKILGFTTDEIVRHGAARSLVAEEDIPKMTEMLVRAIEQKKGWSNLVLRWKHKDGTCRYLESNAVPIFDNAGVLKGFQGSDRDITQRIYAEQSLRESANQYRLLTEKMSDIIWTTDIHLRTTYVSPSVRNVLGFTQEERLSQALEEQLTPDSLSSAWATLNNELAVEKTGNADPQRNITVTLEYYHKDGSTRWLETNISWLRNDQGVATGLHGVARDITNRKLVENALEESEHELKALFKSMLNAFVLFESVFDRDGNFVSYRFVYINDAYERITGVKNEEVKGKTVHEVWPNTEANWVKAYGDVATTGVPNSFDMYHEPTGKLYHCNVYRPRDTKDRFCVVFEDITERKQAEEELRSSEEHLRSIFENAEEIIHLIAWDGTFLHLSPSWERYTGFPVSETVGKSFVSYVHPDDQATCLEVVKKVYETGQPHKISEFRVKHASGKWIWFMNSGTAIKDARGNFLYFSGVATDITERKQVEEKIQRANTLLNSIVENIPNMIFLKDAKELRFTQLNRSGEELLGHSRADLMGKNDYDFFPKEQADFFIQKDREVLRGKEIVDILEEPIQTRDKGVRILHTKKVPILNANGEPEYLMGISEDITDRKQAEAEKRRLEERLRRAEKMEALGQLAGGVAHDLNNVLGVLSGYSELLLAEIPEGQKARKHVEKILQSTVKGAAIIQDLLTLARRGVISEEVIQVNDIVSGFIKTPAFENIRDYHPRVTFRTECDPNLLNIKGSPVHLEKTLMNLLSNAAESISGEGEVTIRTENRYLNKAIVGYDEVKEGDYAVLIVSDTGTGIADEHREKIFEPFYTKKTMGRSGTGLGLSIVWGTVKDHNGYIDVKTKIGAGTSFTLYFPATREATGLPKPRTPVAQYMGHGESVLVVDDIAEQRDVASGLLQKLGYKVHSVSSGEAALEYLKENRADILILDMIMAPGMDGMETYRKVLEIHPKQKAILVSGFSETDRVRKAQLLGAGVYVKKPYVMATIGLAIRKELERSRV